MQPEFDLWCPGAVASSIQLTRDGDLFRASITVTVRLELDHDKAEVVASRFLENVMHVSMDELTAWPVSEETLKRPDGVRVKLPRVDARLRVHRVRGPREPIQDLPLTVEALAIDRDKRLADAGLRADVTISDPNAKLLAIVGVALGGGAIHWPSRDQIVAERALSGSHLYATLPKDPMAIPGPLPIPSAPKRKASRPLPPRRAAPAIAAPNPPPRPGGQDPAAITLDPDDALTLDPDEPLTVTDDVPLHGTVMMAGSGDAAPATASPQTAPMGVGAASPGEAIRLDGTVMLSASDRPPPSQRMTLTVDNRTNLTAWTVPWALLGKHSLTVVVKATCDLQDARPAVVRDQTDPPRGNDFVHGDPAGTLMYPSDNALLKHRADVVLVGHAYAPRGRASQSTVTFRFGRGANAFERSIAVLGPREWRDGQPSSPQLFRSIPLIYERAFGGPGFARNPVGVGFGESHRGLFVPSLEDPAQLLERRGDQRRPCCTAPLSPTWERRQKRVGKKMPRGRLEENWDTLPDDFNWEFFQCAPQAQQLDYLTGDEPFEVYGVRPDDQTLSGQLPGIRPTCSATSSSGARPIPLNIDTVVLDAETLTMHILWRGLLSVSAPHAPELSALTVSL